MTYDGNSLLYYINGAQVASQATQGNMVSINGSLFIGGLNGTEGFVGNIDDLRVYNTALSAAEIQQNMARPAGSPVVPDTTAPTITITSPTPNATISSFSSFTANASDNASIPRVEFFLDGISIGAEDITGPYQIELETTTLGNDTYTINAIAREY